MHDAFQVRPRVHHGTFLDSCNHHCFGCSVEENTWNGPNVRSSLEGLTPAQALQQWYLTSLPQYVLQHGNGTKHFYEQNFPFPCENCCRCNWSLKSQTPKPVK
jgi:hypothetical protein